MGDQGIPWEGALGAPSRAHLNVFCNEIVFKDDENSENPVFWCLIKPDPVKIRKKRFAWPVKRIERMKLIKLYHSVQDFDRAAPLIGETDLDFEPEEADPNEWTAPTALHSDLDLSTLIHWRQALINTQNNKWRFTQAFDHLNWQQKELLKKAQVDDSVVVKEWQYNGIFHTEKPELSEEFGKTFPNGAWYFTRFATMWNLSPGDYIRVPPTPSSPGTWCIPNADKQVFQVPTRAFHATSVENGAKIAKTGGLKNGVSNSGGANGYVFVENEKRKLLGFRYATCTLCLSNPALVKCAVFELCVDRGPTEHGIQRVVRDQWVQQEHRIFITGVFTHIFPIANLYAKGMRGWAAIHESVFDNLQHLQVGEDGHTWLEEDMD